MLNLQMPLDRCGRREGQTAIAIAVILHDNLWVKACCPNDITVNMTPCKILSSIPVCLGHTGVSAFTCAR